MNIEKTVFKRSIVNYNKLIEYGFIEENDLYTYSVNFLNDTFKAIITIDKTGNISGRVWDIQLDDEYTNFRIENSTGEFTNKVKDEYKNILEDIKNNCFINKFFISNQSNRVSNYILERYNINPEFLWDKTPGCGVFKNKNNSKWFGIIMNIDESKLNNNSGEVEIINIKVTRDKLDDLLNKEGFYKAYHMNKKNWISIILNDTVTDEELFTLIDESFDLVSDKL